jgi:periplasmic divalent cation tolerance protein
MGRKRRIRRSDEDQIEFRRVKAQKTQETLRFWRFFAATLSMLTVLTTTAYRQEAEAIAIKLVEAKLAACVQIVPQITSVYFWEGKIEKENEQLLLIKTTEEKYAAVEQFIKENHSYEVPEIVAVRSENVSGSYRVWLEGVVNG